MDMRPGARLVANRLAAELAPVRRSRPPAFEDLAGEAYPA